jgi:hypothetical protein
MTASKSFRTLSALFGHCLTALVTTAIIESELSALYLGHTTRGLYRMEIALSAAIPFLLGFLVYAKWKPTAAKWVCIVGVCGFAWRVYPGTPHTLDQQASWFTFDFCILANGLLWGTRCLLRMADTLRFEGPTAT